MSHARIYHVSKKPIPKANAHDVAWYASHETEIPFPYDYIQGTDLELEMRCLNSRPWLDITYDTASKNYRLTVTDPNAHAKNVGSYVETYVNDLQEKLNALKDVTSDDERIRIMHKIGTTAWLIEDELDPHCGHQLHFDDGDWRSLTEWANTARTGDVLYIANAVDYHY